MAVLEHPDMPKNILDIQGFNPWNALMLSIFISWLVHRRREKLVWDMPRGITALLLLYLAVIVVGFIRMMLDTSHLTEPTTNLISDNLINTIKWAIPGLLLFDGCRDRNRLKLALWAIIGLHGLLAIQVARYVPSSYIRKGEEAHRRMKLDREMGYNAVDCSTMLAGGSWAMMCILLLHPRCRYKLLLIGAAGFVLYSQMLSGGRAGYIAWAGVGLVLCLVRWRKYLLLAPAVPIILVLAFPGAAERMLLGFGQTNVTGQVVTDDYQVTAGRSLVWPYVTEKIGESLLLGYGRQAMRRTGLTEQLAVDHYEDFMHPHNAYLEWLLDNGIVGFFLVMPFYIILLVYGVRLFMDHKEPYAAAAGGLALSLILAQLIAGIGAQSFYPREGTLGMWCAAGLLLRVAVEYARARAAVHRTGPGFYPAVQMRHDMPVYRADPSDKNYGI